MLYYAVVFFVIALVAALFGFVFLIVAILSAVLGLSRRT
jgi:uncharacterized membrane protein YtjA (UPF0391 family)